MEENIGKMMLPFKLQQLLDAIIKKKRLGIEDALHYVYSSDFYKQLSSESSYLWQLSTLNLYDLLDKEKKRVKKQEQSNASPAIYLFLTFCLESYKDYKNISAEDALFLFNKFNVLDYLKEVFDTLHTQGKDYIVVEIDNYINNRKTAQWKYITDQLIT